MTDEPVLFDEPGAGGAPLLWGPGFALAGYLSELALGGPTHTLAWILIGIGLLAVSAVWVTARRRFLSVRLTTETLTLGREELPVARIAEAGGELGAPLGARVLGGAYTVPRKYDELPLRLDDDSIVLAWAKDVEGLRDALTRAKGAQK
ncbi:hypothetical protein [Amycolatopsis suaedae]|uniref:DUF3093 domain-containing protein n=1 Tax=Amycolatopsis suaedae TaxID=2510978 RepID=A0A4Q7JBD1_9PSEU|nr:hypothetical protein [Amycolatopsis suaedae]RZQ64292.1 hypothetical protein EWH70_09950 [Amycolatopsis suaedae]